MIFIGFLMFCEGAYVLVEIALGLTDQTVTRKDSAWPPI
ncbi:hypothetical protein IMCC3088_261 [Aequoribacter fuscus]|uniref:Uncharacterized protein n=1 Tax=Aequoribacter fuscus TaxID=2518989 RepID=F3KZF0_9GAMM|nr:hypothetical protein IMCC3088_261 [Aequoribacter fuscus]